MKSKKTIFCTAGLLLALIFLAAPQAAHTAPPWIPPDQIRYPALEFRMPQAQRIALKNGMFLFYLQDSELPLVSLTALVRTGTLHDPAGKEGLAEITASVMRTGGTAKLGSGEMDRRLDFLAASPSISMSLDSASIHFIFLKSDLDECLDLLSRMLLEPAFEEKKIQEALALKKEELRRTVDNPQTLAFREFNRLLYPGDPRGRYATSASLDNISRKDLISFHREYFSPANMLLAVSGDISREEAVKKIEQVFGDAKIPRLVHDIPAAPRQGGRGFFLIRKPIPQSTVVGGELTISKNHPDFYAFEVLDFLIGSGGFSSRIFSAVRNEEGLAYSAGSFYRARSNYGVFGTYAFTKTASTFQAISLIESILRDAAAGSIARAELDWAKRSIINSFIFSFEQPRQIAFEQMKNEYEKLPADYLTTYREKIEAVTLEDIRRIAAAFLHENRRLTLIVGDADRFGAWPENWPAPAQIVPQP
ncbi:MAG: pitrilysin family protein [Smithellaceae bacterium]|jgi:predicted Zn-dependent peptidase|nr:pitrilysin family protein [Smithellaceae bacterium]MDD3258039.1 pitrilysin family protein [Smithellaceae bacterium]MDD3848102.1 pitrilysin family protein [Smithellaceae bacterium]HOG11875.1 pitrilysin family protein [Smithellaceae bacterium]HOQ71423.1 pitrilysin family protein [Smithellaceae bacterium]